MTDVIDNVKRGAGGAVTVDTLRQWVEGLLRKESLHLAARYGLRNAVLDLGPSGYHFERLVAAVYEEQGYRTEVGEILNGRCITHEVDVIGSKGGHRFLAECKFRNSPGVRCDSKIALYVQARATDLREAPEGLSFDEFRLITNTKFTSEAIRYGECVGLGLLSWDYPKDAGLQVLIQRCQLHPLTCLQSITHEEAHKLLRRGALFCRDLRAKPEPLMEVGFEDSRIELVHEEIDGVITG